LTGIEQPREGAGAPGLDEPAPCQDRAVSPRGRHHRSDLADIARRAMREKGLDPDFPKDALQQLTQIEAPARDKDPAIRDLRDLLWASIDNDDSRDLDQLSVAEELGGGSVKVLIAIADVDALVRKGTPLDSRAARNTTSVYTAGGVFPMLLLVASRRRGGRLCHRHGGFERGPFGDAPVPARAEHQHRLSSLRQPRWPGRRKTGRSALTNRCTENG